MLIWICALHCEAKPVIDFYRLKKSHDDNAFDYYRGDDMACIVSGTGKIASAAACAWIASSNRQAASIAWINLGIAGAAEDEIGTLFSLNQVIDGDDGQRYYPAPATASELPGNACMTLSQASEEYHEDYLFDMEASGFMYSSLRFSSAELIKSFKIVSDNRQFKTGKNRQQVSDLVHRHIESIDQQAQNLRALNEELAQLSAGADSLQRLTAMAHFSQTQKSRLRVLWRYLMNREFHAQRVLSQLEGCSAGAIITSLERLCHQDSEGL